jgi:hypothetical protein
MWIYERATWEYGGGGMFSFIVCQETGGIASAFHRAFARERVKRRSLISNISAGNMLPASYRLGGPGMMYGIHHAGFTYHFINIL